MSTSLLVRKKLVCDTKETSSEFHNFAEECKTKLGYCGISNIEAKLALEQKIGGIFNKLNLAPFDRDSVEKYKKAKEGRAEQILSIVWLIVSLITTAIISYNVIVEQSLRPWEGVAAVLGIGFLCLVCSAIICLGIIGEQIGKMEWNRYPIAESEIRGITIPRFALTTALELREEVIKNGMGCSFFVDALTIKKLPADPFLVVEIQIKANTVPYVAYLEVWDEPNYDVQRTV